MRKKKICFLVPAFNEETVLAHTLESLLKLVSKDDIYVANDNSTDRTAQVASLYTENVITISKGRGKANALNTLIQGLQLHKKYEYIMPVDADTVVAPDFLLHVLPIFESDKEKNIFCVIGKVVGNTHNWLTTFRMWEYELAQTIHKTAQSILGTVIVCPGPSTVFRSSIFEKLIIPTDTITEDMDLTFELHRNNMGTIAYVSKALVQTQDPTTIRQFIRQVDRWYKGFWQCVVKHNIPWGGQRIDFEITFLATEGLFNGLLVVALFLFIPLSILYQSAALLAPLVLDLVFFLIPSFIFTAKRYNTWKLFLYLPHFYIMRVITSFLFLRSFFKVVLVEKLHIYAVWNTPRYERKEAKWDNLLYSTARR
jgi:poly-beta-1,6-N-acetyl-D-glucosamine synthase